MAERGLDRSRYAALERGELNPEYTTIVRLAAALDVGPVAPLKRARL